MATYMSVLPIDVLRGLTEHPDRATILRLPHPRTGIASLFFPVSNSGEASNCVVKILEVQAVAPTEARSWFLGDEVISDGKLLVMTPIDPVFLLLPLLQAACSPDGEYGHHFRPADDIFEDAARSIEASSEKLDDKSYCIAPKDILRFASFRCTKDSLQHICDVKEITSDIIVYRYSDSKALEYLQKKVAHLISAQIVDGSKTLLRGLAKDGLLEDGNEGLLQAACTRAACEVLGQYLPINLRNALLASYDFRALDAHTKNILDEAVKTSEKKATKRGSANATKSSEDKKRKNKASHGVEKLKKANLGGMAKLSNYFTKA